MGRDPRIGSSSMEYAPPTHNNVCTRNCVMRFGRFQFSQSHKHTQAAADDDDDFYSIPAQGK